MGMGSGGWGMSEREMGKGEWEQGNGEREWEMGMGNEQKGKGEWGKLLKGNGWKRLKGKKCCLYLPHLSLFESLTSPPTLKQPSNLPSTTAERNISNCYIESLPKLWLSASTERDNFVNTTKWNVLTEKLSANKRWIVGCICGRSPAELRRW